MLSNFMVLTNSEGEADPAKIAMEIGLSVLSVSTLIAIAQVPYVSYSVSGQLVAIVAAASAWLGLRAGLFTAVAAAVAFNFFVIPPAVTSPASMVPELMLWVSMIGSAFAIQKARQSITAPTQRPEKLYTALEYRLEFAPHSLELLRDPEHELEVETREAEVLADALGVMGMPAYENGVETVALPKPVWDVLFKEANHKLNELS